IERQDVVAVGEGDEARQAEALAQGGGGAVPGRAAGVGERGELGAAQVPGGEGEHRAPADDPGQEAGAAERAPLPADPAGDVLPLQGAEEAVDAEVVTAAVLVGGREPGEDLAAEPARPQRQPAAVLDR